MDDQKICFICRAGDEEKYRGTLSSIEALRLPPGFRLEHMAVGPGQPVAVAFNGAMAASDAGYKVYLDEGALILNENFIGDLAALFERHGDIGLIGVRGAKNIPVNGVWQDAAHKFGRAEEGGAGYGEPAADCEAVEAVDALLVATRCDIPWREESFSESFYAVSQCLEFRRRGFGAAVAAQRAPWCAGGGTPPRAGRFEADRQAFLDEYSQELFPLVSILIPAYNQTRFLKPALESAIGQTYRNTEIIVSDDSTTGEVEEFIRPYLAGCKKLSYFKNTKGSGDFGVTNCARLLGRSHGEYVNFLFHDDLFAPRKIELMMNYMLCYPNVTLVTSYRQTINQEGTVIPQSAGAFRQRWQNDTMIGGRELSRMMINENCNFIGEPTVVLFKKKYLNESGFYYYGDRAVWMNVDVAMWLTLLEHGDGIYMAEPLSSFRLHDTQNSAKPEIAVSGLIDWFYIAQVARQKGLFASDEEYERNLYLNLMLSFNYFHLNPGVVSQYPERVASLAEELHKAIDICFSKKPESAAPAGGPPG